MSCMTKREMTDVTAKITGKSIEKLDEATQAQKRARAAVDEKLLANARGKSINELSELTGLSAPEVAERLSRLYEEKDWMTERMQERQMLLELGDVIADARKRMENAEDKDYGTIGKIVLGAFQQMADRWDARRRLVEADIEKITNAHARLFGRAFDATEDFVVDAVTTLYPQISVSEMRSFFDEGLLASKAVLEEYVND